MTTSPTHRISLENRVIVITGASRGIGEAIAYAAAEAGARLVLGARKQEGVDRVAGAIREGGGEAVPVACHVGKDDQVQALFSRAVEELGRVDGLVNNAGTNPHFGPLLDVEDAAFDKTFEVNLKGYLYPTRAYVKHLNERDADRGSVVNIASIAGMRASPMQGVYAMTKAGVISMTQTLAAELGGSNIRVNAIAPGFVDTRLAAAIVKNEMLHKYATERTPLGRVAQPAEIAAAAVYLLSDAATFTTGAVFPLDGGLTAV